MTEPGVLIAEQCSGPSYFDGVGVPAAASNGSPSSRVTLSRAEVIASLATEVARSRELRRQYAEMAPTAPQGASEGRGSAVDFVAAVDKLVQLGVPYGTACQKISQEFPDLYEQHRQWSMLDN